MDMNTSISFTDVKLTDNEILLTADTVLENSVMYIYNENVMKLYENGKVENDKTVFHFPLSYLETFEKGDYDVVLYVNDKFHTCKSTSMISFEHIATQNGNFNKVLKFNISNKANIVIASPDLAIRPVAQSVAFEKDELVIRGNLHCPYDIFHLDNIINVARLAGKDRLFVITLPVKLKQNEFELRISKDVFVDMHRKNCKHWDLSFDVMKGEEVLDSVPFTKSKKFKSSILLMTTLFDDNVRINMDFIARKSDQSLYFSFKYPISITKITCIEAKTSKILIHIRLSKRMGNLYKKMNWYVNDMDTKHLCGVKKAGAKTLILTLNTNEVKEELRRMDQNGYAFYFTLKEDLYRNTIYSFDKTKLYYSFFQKVVNSKKYKALGKKIYNLCLKLPVNKKKILFESFLGRNISGNPKYLYRYLQNNGYDKKYKMYWIVNNKNEEPEGNGKKIVRRSIRYYFHMATAGYWMFNTRQDDFIVKRPEQTYLQTWHGTPLKRLGMDMDNVSMATVSNIADYKRSFFNNSRRWDYLLAQNTYSANIFKRCFAFNKELLDYGYPANDVLYTTDEKGIEDLKKKFNLPLDKKIILYAPTWRDDNFLRKGFYQMNMKLELDKMMKELGDEYIVLLRMHYLIMNEINISDYEGFAYDFSSGCDIQELYLVSDMMITDYSSTMFDFANLKRPIIFFAYDIDDYRDSLRGFYFDFENEACGPIVKTTNEVIDAIVNVETWRKEYHEKEIAFYEKFNHIDDGFAAKRVIEKILK